MKTSVTQTPAFQPVNVNIVLETEHEVFLFSQLMMANIRIPDLLIKDDSIKTEDRQQLIDMMSNIYRGPLQKVFNANYYRNNK
jgi:hypothetical protein